MTGTSIIDIGKLAEPATKLIEKVSDAIGGIAKPWQMERVAKAESKAAFIKAHSEIEITDIHRRALARLANEEAQKQQNMESIAYGATKYLTDQSQPENIDPDWMTYAFDRCRHVSNEEIQNIWSRILASEANNPGNVSRLTLDALAKIDNNSANLFLKLTECVFEFDDGSNPHFSIVYYRNIPFFREYLSFDDINILEEIGLVKATYTPLESSPYSIVHEIRNPICVYGTKTVQITADEQNCIQSGTMILTNAGDSLFHSINRKTNIDVYNAVVDAWRNLGYNPKEVATPEFRGHNPN